MRLTREQIRIVREQIHAGFGATARIRVFGSQTRDEAIGGDIDLLVELPQKATLAQEISVSAQLECHLGVPVDLITTWPGQPSRPIVEIARLTGVAL